MPQQVRGRSHTRLGPHSKVLLYCTVLYCTVAIKKRQDSTVWSLSQNSRVRNAALQLHQVQDLTSTSSRLREAWRESSEAGFCPFSTDLADLVHVKHLLWRLDLLSAFIGWSLGSRPQFSAVRLQQTGSMRGWPLYSSSTWKTKVTAAQSR